ncbi:hypothetical protein BD770DRAFT_416183 [Pilaira anomala]|nr:hypothetical protein BD770DRAFT_416183 [Pilaira anomala]
MNKTNAPVVEHTPIAIPVKLTASQKKGALPFLPAEPVKSNSTKPKCLKRLFKKLAKAAPYKCTNKFTEKKTHYKLTFVPIVKKNEVIAPSKAETTEIVWYDNNKVDESAIELAQRIWDEDNTVYSNLNKVVEWIGNGKESSNAILQSYMSHFDFHGLNLEQAFRILCSKLYLNGETQQIDRVLLQFSTHYFECNSQSIFGSIDVIHAIVYSLLLLNTDLHVAQGDYKKMSQTSFIKNTMNAISVQSGNTSIKSWTPLQRTPSNTSDVSMQSYTYARSLESSMPRNMSSLSIGSKTWESEIKSMLKQMYTSIRYNQITDPSSPLTSMNNNRVSAAIRRSVGSMIKKKPTTENDSDNETVQSVESAISSIMYYQAVASHLQNTELPMSYTSNAPYYKEGMVSRKHLLESSTQKAKHRDWKDCFMIIERSQLRMYKLECSSNSNSSFVGDGNWMSHAQLMGTISLKHALANPLPSGYSSQRQHAFTLQASNGAIYVFQVGSSEQVEEWVSTCNYWAARESKEPLVGGISSMEYGWGHCLESGSTSAMIHEWQSPASPTISSQLEESAQLETLHNHVQNLTTQLDQHYDIKTKMETHFIGSKYNARALINWENKSVYLLREIIKYQNYCNSIENSLALQARIMT